MKIISNFKKIHYFIKKIIKIVLNTGFLFGYYIWYFLKRTKNWYRYYKSKSLINVENDLNETLHINIKEEINSDLNYVVEEYKWDFYDNSKKLPINKSNLYMINKKNEFKELLSSFLIFVLYSYITFLCFYLIIQFFFFKNDDENIKFDTMNENGQIEKKKKKDNYTEISWFHADIESRQYETFDEMKKNFNDIMSQPCRPLTRDEIENNHVYHYNDNSFHTDLSLIYHMLCHLATKESLENDKTIITTPKILNVTNLRKLNEEWPQHLFHHDDNENLEFLYSEEIPNLCIAAIYQHQHNHDHTDHHHWSFEKQMKDDFPIGAFIHTSIKNVTLNNTNIQINPFLNKSISDFWKLTPTMGECSILINPEISQINDNSGNNNNRKYEITYNNPILKEKKVFTSYISKESEFKYTDLNNNHRHWSPKSQQENIFFQITLDMLYSKNCLENCDDI